MQELKDHHAAHPIQHLHPLLIRLAHYLFSRAKARGSSTCWINSEFRKWKVTIQTKASISSNSLRIAWSHRFPARRSWSCQRPPRVTFVTYFSNGSRFLNQKISSCE